VSSRRSTAAVERRVVADSDAAAEVATSSVNFESFASVESAASRFACEIAWVPLGMLRTTTAVLRAGGVRW
jgi:hypothetical protein